MQCGSGIDLRLGLVDLAHCGVESVGPTEGHIAFHVDVLLKCTNEIVCKWWRNEGIVK